jgi:prolyl-tRNA editing enzyme YbaK/EbsC (Cys-tRNA(Pro) deacylase)
VGLGQRVVEREQIGATVEQAAVSIGCEPARIAKTMSVFLDEKAALIVMAGDAKIDKLVETYIGHFPGAVCPFAVKVGVRVYLDVSLKRFDIIYTAGGNLNSTVKLSLEELETHSASAGWIDVCKGWFVD